MTDSDPPPDFMNDMRPPSMRPGLKALVAAGIILALVLLAVAAII
jgi:hypothetical protein